MKKSESIVEISKALAEFRKEVKQPMKDGNNPFFKSKYVPLENVIEAIDETAPKTGLSFTQWALNNSEGTVGVATLLLHTSGEFIEYDPVFMKGEKQTPQGAGSVISYLKRYTLSAIFGITSDQDDDGNGASQSNNNKQSNKLPVQDKGKVMLVNQNANDLAQIINAQPDADTQNPTTQEQIVNAYLKKVGANNIKQATNEQLITMTQYIKKNIDKYKEETES